MMKGVSTRAFVCACKLADCKTGRANPSSKSGRTSSSETSGIPRFIADSGWLVPEAASPKVLLSLLQEAL
jgi:hypothetical protein